MQSYHRLDEQALCNQREANKAVSRSGLLIFCAVAELQNSGKSVKSLEIHKNTQNTVKLGKNLIKCMSVQHI